MRNVSNTLWSRGHVVAYNTMRATIPFDGYTFLKRLVFPRNIINSIIDQGGDTFVPFIGHVVGHLEPA